MRSSSYLLFSLLFISHLHSQVIITGQFENLPPNGNKKFAIDVWNDEKWNQADTFSLNAENGFSKKYSDLKGQAKIRAWGNTNKWMDFLIIPNEKGEAKVDFGKIDFREMNGVASTAKDKENEAYGLLINSYRTYQIQRDSLLKNGIGSHEITKMNITKLNEDCAKVKKMFPGTYAAEVLAKLFYVPQPEDYGEIHALNQLKEKEFYKSHLIDKLPLNDSKILWHYGLLKVLNTYWLNFNRNDSSEMKLYIDKIMSKRKGNEEVDAWIFKSTLMKFINLKDDAALTYLLTWYSPGCSIDEINTDNSIKTLLNALKNCVVGKKAFPLSLPDSSGKLISLPELASKAKLTLLFLWRSDCSHCHEFKPKLQELYNKYKSKGLEVIGVLLDPNKNTTGKKPETVHTTWIKLNAVTPEQKQAIIRNYPIPGTPSIIAVDKNYVVKNRMVIRATIDQYLEQEFGK